MNKKQMIAHLVNHARYDTMSSWNNARGYAHTVKVHSLPLTEKEKGVLYDLIGTEEFYDDVINPLIANWEADTMMQYGSRSEKKEISINIDGLSASDIAKRRKAWETSGYTYDRHGTKIMTMWKIRNVSNFTAGLNGRSAGHLVLYKWNGHNSCGTGWTHDKEELEEMTADEVRGVYSIVRAFDGLYDDLVRACKRATKDYKAEDVEETYTKTVRRMTEK